MEAKLRELDRAARAKAGDGDEKHGLRLVRRHMMVSHDWVVAAKKIRAEKRAA